MFTEILHDLKYCVRTIPPLTKNNSLEVQLTTRLISDSSVAQWRRGGEVNLHLHGSRHETMRPRTCVHRS